MKPQFTTVHILQLEVTDIFIQSHPDWLLSLIVKFKKALYETKQPSAKAWYTSTEPFQY